MVRRSSRLAKKPNVNYHEDAQWERAVRKAEIQRDKARLPTHGTASVVRDEFNRPVGEDWQLDTPEQRVDRVLKAPMRRKPRRPQPIYNVVPMTRTQRNLLFMNPGDTPLAEAIYSLARKQTLPEWALQFQQNLYQKEGVLYFRDGRIDLPMAWKQEKRDAVKRLYFDPKEPSTIQPVTDDLRGKFANISKRNVTHILRSLETYQLNFGRRLPPKIASRTLLKQPGIIAMDMFFPSKLLGWWGKFRCLTCMDTWSRFCRVYALEKKDYQSTKRAMENFLSEFASLGHLPRRIISDRGTDMAPTSEVMEKYRQHKDRDDPLIIHSKTGQPVLIVEALNAQVQRRMQVLRTANLTDDPSTILEDISDQINNQKRPDRGNLTPLQLLSLNREQRATVNVKNNKPLVGIETDLKELKIGNRVRYLIWDRKEQVHGGLSARFKGFAPKWSKNTYTVVRKVGLRRNPGNYYYDIGLKQAAKLLRSRRMRELLDDDDPRPKEPQMFLRHELLSIPYKVDRQVPTQFMEHRQTVVAPGEDEWNVDDYPSDDSRAE
jgi:hypothetical protein